MNKLRKQWNKIPTEYFLALTEWRRSFPLMGGKGESRLDFFWLILLLTLAMSFTLVLIATKEGLTNRLMDVVLGYNKGYGVPVQTIANYQRSDGLNDATLTQFTDKLNQYKSLASAFPYIEIATNDFLSLPYSTKENHEFDGWAVKTIDPLLKENKSTLPLQLQITLNERLFNRTFSCQKYTNAISTTLLSKDMPLFDKTKKTPKEACLSDNKLWLKITLNGHQQLVPFQVHWYSPRFPISKPVSYMISIPQYYQLGFLRGRKNIFYNFKDPQDKTWINTLKYIKGSVAKEQSQTLLSCLRADIKTWEKERLKMTDPVSIYFVKNCAEKANIPFYKDIRFDLPENESEPDHYLTIYGANQLGGITFNQGFAQTLPPCVDFDRQCKKNIKINIISNKIDYSGVVFYVTERTRVMEVIKKIKPTLNNDKVVKGQPDLLVIYSAYENALIRFNFLKEIIDLLKSVYQVILGLLIGLLLGVQMGFIISHRQRFIAILTAQGMHFMGIFKLFLTQILLSMMVATFLTWSFLNLPTWYMQEKIIHILGQNMYQDYISISPSGLNLLPLESKHYAIVALIFFGICSILLFIFLKLAHRKETASIL